MRSSALLFTIGSLAIFVPSILARSLRLQKRAAFYIANETACIVDSIVYYNGDPIPTDDPCEACKCRPPGFACVLRECEVKPGCRAVRKAGHCCPEYVCGCEHNGRMYRDGDEIRDSQNPCYTCHCQGSAIACAFVDCFFRVDCAPDYVPGECCPRYDHCSPLASTVDESSSKVSYTTPSPGTSPAPTEAKNPETTIKVEVFTELSLFGLPDLGFNSVIESTDTELSANNPESPDDNGLQIGIENTKDESPSIATTLESISSTTDKTESQSDATAPVFYLPKKKVESTEKEKEDKEPETDNLERVETTSLEPISDDLPNADEVVTSDAESSSKPALYVHDDNSEPSEKLTTLSDESSDDKSSRVYDNKQDTSVKDTNISEENFSTLSPDLTTISIVRDKIATTTISATPIPVLLLNAKVSISNKEENKKLDEDIILSKTTGKPAISTDIVDEMPVVSELTPEEVTDQKTHDSTVDASSVVSIETTSVIDVTTSKSNRIGKQNEEQSEISTAETAGQTTTNDNEIETTTEMLVLRTTNTEPFGTDGTTLKESKDELPLAYAKGVDKPKPVLNTTENSATSSESTTTETKAPAEITETKSSAETTETKSSEASAEVTEAKASTEIIETKASTKIIKSTEPVDDQTTPESASTTMTTESLPLKTETDLTKESETTVEDLTSEK